MAKILPDGRIEYDQITKPEVVQANYLASRQDEHWIDDLINGYTGLMPWNWGLPPCSHTEIGVWLDDEPWFFSSTSRKELGGKNGTRWIKGIDMLRNPERWLLQTKTLSGKAQVAIRISGANKLIGLGYDFYGVVTDFINPIRVCFKGDMYESTPKKIYCSKAVHAVDTGEIIVVSPKRRYKIAKKLGYKTIDDTWQWVQDNVR